MPGSLATKSQPTNASRAPATEGQSIDPLISGLTKREWEQATQNTPGEWLSYLQQEEKAHKDFVSQLWKKSMPGEDDRTSVEDDESQSAEIMGGREEEQTEEGTEDQFRRDLTAYYQQIQASYEHHSTSLRIAKSLLSKPDLPSALAEIFRVDDGEETIGILRGFVNDTANVPPHLGVEKVTDVSDRSFLASGALIQHFTSVQQIAGCGVSFRWLKDSTGVDDFLHSGNLEEMAVDDAV